MTEFHAGDQIGDYRLEARLGHGGFGTVWRARHVESGRIVALKVLPENDALQDSATLRADVELLAASAASNSRHVVQVLGGGTDPVPHVVMEFVNGSSLSEELKSRGKLSQQEVIEIGLGIAEALEALQAAGIVHRDVKPSNVLIDRDGTVKLTDFGIAKIAGYDAVTVTGQLPLSISYAAPEVWEGKAEHRSDLYALGVLLYQCLSGTLPFRGAYAELFYQHRTSEPDLTALPAGTAPSLLDLISICLRKDPAERPESATTCKVLLLRAREESTAPAAEAQPLVEPPKFGPWQREGRHPAQPWAWYCKNTETGQEAVVEVHFASDAAYGEQLRKAVAENPRLTPLGAEHLIQTNRLILRPGEAWTDPPAGQFQFWVAREEIALPPPPSPIGAAALLGYTESLQALIAEAADARLVLHLNSDTVHLLPDGTVHLRRPGLDVRYEGDPERDAIDLLKSQPLSREVRPLVSRAGNLDELHSSLERLLALTGATVSGSLPQRRGQIRMLTAIAASILIVAIGIGAIVALQPQDQTSPDGGVVRPAATATPPVAAAACLNLNLQSPVPLATAEGVCTQGASFRFDATCPVGYACSRQIVDGAVIVGVNDRAVAYVNPDGYLVVGRENSEAAISVSRANTVTSAAWSPDGRYLAYLTVERVAGANRGNEPAVATQLRIVDPGRPANDGLLLSSTNLRERTPDSLQRLISSPQWSPDGRSLYFLWSLPDGQGAEVFAVEVPRNPGGDVDFSRLRSGGPPEETRLDFPMTRLALTPSDFGLPTGTLTGFYAAPNGALYLQICQGSGSNRGCGLGVWDGTASLVLEPVRGVQFSTIAASPYDGVIHAAVSDGSTWRIARLEDETLVTLPGISLPATTGGPAPTFAFHRRGDSLLLETAEGRLSLVSYGSGTGPAWGQGRAPVWYTPRRPDAPPFVPPPAATAFATPASTPTPVATATPPPLLPMTLTLTVRRNGNPVSGVRVVASVNDVECGTVITLAGPTVMNFPSPNTPAVCRQPGATIRFTADGHLLATPIATYMPQASLPFDLIIP